MNLIFMRKRRNAGHSLYEIQRPFADGRRIIELFFLHLAYDAQFQANRWTKMRKSQFAFFDTML